MKKSLKRFLVIFMTLVIMLSSTVTAEAATKNQTFLLNKKSKKTYSKTISNDIEVVKKTIKKTAYFQLIQDRKQRVKVVDKYTKGSKYKKRTTTTTPISSTYCIRDLKTSSAYVGKSVEAVLGKNFVNAFKQTKFKIIYNPVLAYDGVYDARTRAIYITDFSDKAMFHYLGHLLYAISLRGSGDKKIEWDAIYQEEKSKNIMPNVSYADVSHEFYAQCLVAYVLNPEVMKKNTPKSYAIIQKDLNSINNSSIATFNGFLGQIK